MAGGCCRSHGFRVTFRTDMLRSPRRRRRLRPAFCMTGHSPLPMPAGSTPAAPENGLMSAPGRSDDRSVQAAEKSSQQVRPLRVRRNGGARQRQMSVTAADGRRCSWLWTAGYELWVVDHKLWIVLGKMKIISLTSMPWRRAEHRPVNLMEPFSFHQTHLHRSSGSCRRAGVANEFHFPPVTQAPSGRLPPHPALSLSSLPASRPFDNPGAASARFVLQIGRRSRLPPGGRARRGPERTMLRSTAQEH